MLSKRMLPDVIIANLNHFFTGITATLENLYPLQARQISIGIHGYNLACETRKVSLLDILRYGRTPPDDKPFRIFHARRAVDLRRGLFLRDFCGVKIKVIFTSVKQSRHSFPLRRMIARSDGVIALTQEAARLRPNVLAVIPHGIDLKRFVPANDENWHNYATQHQLHHQLSSTTATRAIGQIGNIRRKKGSDMFVRALCQVLPEFPNALGVIAGRWLLKDALLRYRLQKMTKKAGVDDRVLWLGLTAYEDMPKLLRALDLYVSSSLQEGFSMAMLEALACGTPLLATKVGGASVVVEQGKTGYLINAGDEQALKKYMRQFLKMPNPKARMVAACRARAEQRFNIEREANEIIKVYKKLWAQS